MRKLFAGLAMAVAVMTLPTAASADTVSDEAAFVTLINELRASKGLPGLEVHANLVDKARGWAATMGNAGRIWHSTLSDGITADWRKLGENVGMGGSVQPLHDAFIASPKHYANLVDPEFNYVGIGVAYVGGTLYVSELFMKLAGAAVVAPPAPVPPAPVPAPTPTAPAPAPAPAAKPKPQPRPAPTPAPAPERAPAAAPPAPEPPPPPPPPEPSPLLISVLTRLHDFGV